MCLYICRDTHSTHETNNSQEQDGGPASSSSASLREASHDKWLQEFCFRYFLQARFQWDWPFSGSQIALCMGFSSLKQTARNTNKQMLFVTASFLLECAAPQNMGQDALPHSCERKILAADLTKLELIMRTCAEPGIVNPAEENCPMSSSITWLQARTHMVWLPPDTFCASVIKAWASL